MIYLTDIDLNQNQLMNAVIQPLAAAPSSPKLGQIYCDSTNSRIKWYNGTAWAVIGVVVESSAANGSIKVDGVEMKVYTLPAATANALGGIKVGSGLKVAADGTLSVDVVNSLESDETTKSLSAAQGKALKTAIDNINDNLSNLGGGDMLKSVYDTNNNGKVDKADLADKASDADKLGGQLPTYYAKATDIPTVPTSLSSFTNDTGFITNTVENLTNYYKKSETFTKTEVNTLIGNLALIQISVVDSLPATGKTNVIYLVPKSGGSGTNVKDEYLWTGTAFEKIGDTTIDLTPYAKSADLATVAKTGKYGDLLEKPTHLVSKKLTLEAGKTSATVAEPNFSGYVCAYNATTGEGVLCDWTYGSGSLTVDINSAQSYSITIIYNVTA